MEGAHEYAGRLGINLRLQNGVHVRPWSPDRLLKYLRQTNKKKSSVFFRLLFLHWRRPPHFTRFAISVQTYPFQERP